MSSRAAPLLALAALLPTAAGCTCGSCFDYFSNIAIEGLVLGLEDPVEGIDIGAAAASTAFVGEAASLSDLEANLLDDADRVWVQSAGTGEVDMAAAGNGLYEATSDDEPTLAYTVGAVYTMHLSEGGESFSVSKDAPAPPELSPVPAPGTHPASSPLSFDLTAGGYDNHLAVVADTDGNLTYDNRPETVGDYIDWIGGDEVGVITIPGTAFPDAGATYVLGVAGLFRADDADMDGFNPLVSNLAIGSMAVEPIVTAP